jgi:hypothetical protein
MIDSAFIRAISKENVDPQISGAYHVAVQRIVNVIRQLLLVLLQLLSTPRS